MVFTTSMPNNFSIISLAPPVLPFSSGESLRASLKEERRAE
jgi:hypothetical protein